MVFFGLVVLLLIAAAAVWSWAAALVRLVARVPGKGVRRGRVGYY